MALLSVSLVPIANWMQSTHVAQAIRHSATLIASLEIIHLIGMTLLIGSILMIDLSLLGFGIGTYPASRVSRDLSKWMIAGLCILLSSGPLILSAEAERCFRAPMFWVKMALLACAIAFHFAKHRAVSLLDPPAARTITRPIAVISLVLWIGVAVAAKSIQLEP